MIVSTRRKVYTQSVNMKDKTLNGPEVKQGKNRTPQ